MPQKAFHWLAIFSVLSLVLAGCAVPTSMKVASLALDAFSYVGTQKSVMDHGLSLISGQDCAMLRLVTEGSACRRYESTRIDFNGNLTPDETQSFWSRITECDTVKIEHELPAKDELWACAQRLVDKFGDFGALDYADKRIERLVNSLRTDDAGIWTAIHLAVRQNIDASYGRVVTR
ncbi:MAG: hypothetical protein JKY92_00560 [Magnetovibrio sp.]|nr:hypothetical protein [Magnetovibrio sp.]